MPASSTHWKPVIIATALLIAGSVWLVWPSTSTLSPLEKSLVGSWTSTNAFGAWVLEFHPDRTCLSRKLDGSAFVPGDSCSLPGTWMVRDGSLLCDWRPRTGGYIEFLTQRWATGKDHGEVVEVTAERAVIRYPRGTVVTYSRLE